MKEFDDFLDNANSEEALEDVIKSGLSPEILKLAQVKVFNGSKEELQEKLGFSIDISDRIFIEFPYFTENGSILFYRYKVLPAIVIGGKEVKYLHPKNTSPVPYILPTIWEVKDKPNKPLWITEGEKKALKLIQHGKNVIALSGVWNFKAGKDSETSPENKSLFPELRVFNWRGRNVYLAFDMDLWINPLVREALYELAFKLKKLGAVIKLPYWDKNKGIDDYLTSKENPEEALDRLEKYAKHIGAFVETEHWEEIKRAFVKANLSNADKREIINSIAKKKEIKPKDLWSEYIQEEKESKVKQVKVLSIKDLMQREFLEYEWIYKDFLPIGLTILAGKPKIGKSFLALKIALEVAREHTVVYMSYEDKQQQMQGKLKILFNSNENLISKNLYIPEEVFTMNYGGIEQLEYLCSQYKPKLIVIDTLQKFRGLEKGNNLNIYASDYDLIGQIKEIADKFNIAILIIHHTKKGESDDPVELISGTTGISGGVDTLLILKKKRNESEAILYINGRNVSEREIAMRFEDGNWEFLGEASEHQKSIVRQKIKEVLIESGEPLTCREITDLTGLKAGAIKGTLHRMVNDNEIEKDNNKYKLKENYIPEEFFEYQENLKNEKGDLKDEPSSGENLKNEKLLNSSQDLNLLDTSKDAIPSSFSPNQSEKVVRKIYNTNNCVTLKLFNGLPSSEEEVTPIGYIQKDSVTCNQIVTQKPVTGYTNKKNVTEPCNHSGDAEEKAKSYTVTQNINNNFFSYPSETQIQAMREGYSVLMSCLGDLKIEEVKPCRLCGSKIFWRDKLTNDVNCVKCHPPPDENIVAGWIGNWLEDNEMNKEILITQTDNKLVKIKSKTSGLTFLKDKWSLEEDLTLEEGKVYELPLILANYLINERWAEILEYGNE